MPDPTAPQLAVGTATSVPLDEILAASLYEKTSMDEDDAWEAVQALLPLVTAHALAEYERGYKYGEMVACRRVADRLGLHLIDQGDDRG